MRKRARVDSNQSEIVKALRSIGCSVLPTHQLGAGAPDIAVGLRGHTLFLEIKDGDKPPSEQQLTQDEQRFMREWRGHYAVVHNVIEAIDEVRRFA